MLSYSRRRKDGPRSSLSLILLTVVMLLTLVRNTIVRNIRVRQHPSHYYYYYYSTAVRLASAFSPNKNSIQSAATERRRETSRTMVSLLSAVPLSFIQTKIPATTKEESKVVDGSTAPPILLLHGLDSSSHTWTSLIQDLGATGYNAIAVDQRGCGNSPLGDPHDFTPETLVEDLYQCLAQHPLFRNNNKGWKQGFKEVRPFVIVGHSMGGRVAMSFAAKYPELVAALIIEDMDIRTRPLALSAIQSPDRNATINFDRTFSNIGNNKEEILQLFETEGYPPARVAKWFGEGRIEHNEENGRYYSRVNPAFRLLCYEQFFVTDQGETTWTQLMALPATTTTTVPIHLMVADPSMTVCDETSITRMHEIHQSQLGILMRKRRTDRSFQVTRYPGATHSIHNSASERFTHDLKAILDAL